MELHLKLIGILLILLAMIHLIFPNYFNWKKELNDLIPVNRQMMYVHTFFIALTVLLIGILCVSSAKELIETQLGARVALGLCIFWTVRLFVQFFVYSPALWKGKRFETIIHVLFSLLWVYLSVVFFLVYFLNRNI
jgi:hypothetical protein